MLFALLYTVLRVDEYRSRVCRLVFLLLGLLYPWSSLNAFQMFPCTKLGSNYYLNADYRLQCFNDSYYHYQSLAIVNIIIFTTGYPAISACALIIARRKFVTTHYHHNTNDVNNDGLDDSVDVDNSVHIRTSRSTLRSPVLSWLLAGFGPFKLTSLYRSYHHSYQWWEQVELIRQMSFTALILAPSNGVSMKIALIVCFISCMAQIAFQPHCSRVTSTYHTMTLVSLFFITSIFALNDIDILSPAMSICIIFIIFITIGGAIVSFIIARWMDAVNKRRVVSATPISMSRMNVPRTSKPIERPW